MSLTPCGMVAEKPQAPLRIFGSESNPLDGIDSSADLDGIARSLSAWIPSARQGISLCLYGPGPGKSDYARYLARRMGRTVVLRRGPDLLLGERAGGPERSLAAAFREAEDTDALLLFEEADAFLRRPGGASRSREPSRAGFLQRLEAFQGVVVCTTDLVEELDPVALRRFVFQIEFRRPPAPAD